MSGSPEAARVDHSREGRAKRYTTIDEALQAHGAPAANQALVRRIVENADVAGFVGYRTHFKIERRGGGPALEVHFGYTNGFRSEADVVRLAGDVERWPSKRFQGAWGVTHPESRARTETEPRARRTVTRAAAAPERVEAVCPNCFMVMPRTGVCANCGE